jgi:FdhE protein
MMVAVNRSVFELGRQYPEWQPWLTVIEEVLREATDSRWEAFVPEPPELQESKVPLLAGATLSLGMTGFARWSERLFQVAYRSGAPKMATLDLGKRGLSNAAVNLLSSALCQDGKRLCAIAADLGVDADALQAVALLVPVPLLQACNRRWASSIAKSWTEGYCPVCGAWPAFAEVRGIERGRYLRCGRCGGEWQAQRLFCSYCGIRDHKELVSLVPQKNGLNAVIDACKRCLGYVKTLTTLQGSPPARVIVDDLASVDLDIAALEQGYRRPEGTGYSLDIKVGNKPSLSERILFWRT